MSCNENTSMRYTLFASDSPNQAPSRLHVLSPLVKKLCYCKLSTKKMSTSLSAMGRKLSEPDYWSTYPQSLFYSHLSSPKCAQFLQELWHDIYTRQISLSREHRLVLSTVSHTESGSFVCILLHRSINQMIWYWLVILGFNSTGLAFKISKRKEPE